MGIFEIKQVKYEIEDECFYIIANHIVILTLA